MPSRPALLGDVPFVLPVGTVLAVLVATGVLLFGLSDRVAHERSLGCRCRVRPLRQVGGALAPATTAGVEPNDRLGP